MTENATEFDVVVVGSGAAGMTAALAAAHHGLRTVVVEKADRFGGSHAEFSPDGRWVYTCGDEGVLRVWAAKTGKLAKELDPPGFIRPYAPPASAPASEPSPVR